MSIVRKSEESKGASVFSVKINNNILSKWKEFVKRENVNQKATIEMALIKIMEEN